MKTKIILSTLALGLFVTAYCQKPSLELTFTAENNGQYVPLDSILIENLTQDGDTTLYAPDTLLSLQYTLGINETDLTKNAFIIYQNYPNPFRGKTEVDLYLPEKEHIKISVRDILGRELTHYEKKLNPGNHSFAFYPGNQKYYLLTVTGKQTSQTIKMLNINNNTTFKGKCKIVYNKYKDNSNDSKSREAINNFRFNLGDKLKFTAFTDVEETEITDIPSDSQTYTFQFDGWTPCPGIPTVTDIDGNIYNTVQIGSQCWMKENLRTTTYRNGTPIPNITDDSIWSTLTTGAYVWYDNDVSWKGLYGALYNWHTTVDSNGLCPSGWHVPTNDEWLVLSDSIGGPGSPHGNWYKSCRQVNSPLGVGCKTTEHPRWNESDENGTDKYGFSGLPGGYHIGINIPFNYIGKEGFWWSSSSDPGTWYRSLKYNSGNIHIDLTNDKSGLSVRCIRD